MTIWKSYYKSIIKELYELSNATLEEIANGSEEFIAICQKTLNRNSPTQTKVCAGQPFVFYEQNLFRRNNACKYLKNKLSIQNNEIIVPPLRKSKKEYYSSLKNIRSITGNIKCFGKQ